MMKNKILQLTQIKTKLLKRKVKYVIPIISFILFVGNYQICEYFYPNNIKEWWHLKVDIYSIIIALLFIYSSLFVKRWIRFLFDIFVGLTVSNVIDRIVFNVRDFKWNDILMIAITFVFAFYNLRNAYRIK